MLQSSIAVDQIILLITKLALENERDSFDAPDMKAKPSKGKYKELVVLKINNLQDGNPMLERIDEFVPL